MIAIDKGRVFATGMRMLKMLKICLPIEFGAKVVKNALKEIRSILLFSDEENKICV